MTITKNTRIRRSDRINDYSDYWKKSKPLSPEFYTWLREFTEEYKEVLKELAKY